MVVKNCVRCGKVFTHIAGAPLCSICKGKDDEDFKRIKEYLEENPGANITEVSTVLDISLNKLKRFLREGRLEVIEWNNYILDCERCGKSIKTGRYCESCNRDITMEMKSITNLATNKMKGRNTDGSKAKEKMRYLNRDILK